MSSQVKVGIPQALFFYTYYPAWRTFFEELGVSVVTSGATTKGTLDAGVQEAVTDACAPIKLYHGHVAELRGKVDYLFVPRLVSTNGKLIYCPKFLGLPDMIRHSMADLPKLIDVRIDTRKGKHEWWRVYREIGRNFTHSTWKIYRAYRKAMETDRQFDGMLKAKTTAPDALKALYGEELAGGKVQPPKSTLEVAAAAEPASSGALATNTGSGAGTRLTIGILGYPYAIYDPYLSANLLNKLEALGVTPVAPDMIPDEVLERQAGKFPKELFWTYSDRAVKAAYHFLENGRGQIDGLIHLTAFACGPDFIVNKLVELECKKLKVLPFMSLMYDEQTGEAGVLTRLEAFVDMVRRRKEAAERKKVKEGANTSPVNAGAMQTQVAK